MKATFKTILKVTVYLYQQGVTNLRSIDYNKNGNSAACQEVNYDDVSMSATSDWDTFQFHSTLNPAQLYAAKIKESTYKKEAHWRGYLPTESVGYSLLIGWCSLTLYYFTLLLLT